MCDNKLSAESWAAFVDLYGPLVFGHCRKRGLQHQDAEDVTQRVFAQVAQSIRGFQYDPAVWRFRDWLGTVVRNAVNGGWAGGNNTGIRYALERGANHILLLNNDTTVAPALVDNLLAAAAANPDYGILGPVINFMDEPHAVMTDGSIVSGTSLRVRLIAARRPSAKYSGS